MWMINLNRVIGIIVSVLTLCAAAILPTSGTDVEDITESTSLYTTEEESSTPTEESSSVIDNDEEYTESVNATVVEEGVEETEVEYVVYYTDGDAIDIAKLLFKECGGVDSKTEQACVAWCVLNRVDESGTSIHDVLRSPNQFAFYESTQVRDDLLELAYDVLSRWNDEKNGIEDSGRVLPKEYTYFSGDGSHNYFRNAFDGSFDVWDYSLESPYES